MENDSQIILPTIEATISYQFLGALLRNKADVQTYL